MVQINLHVTDAAKLTEVVNITLRNIDVLRANTKDPKGCGLAFLVSVIRHMPEEFERLKNLSQSMAIAGPNSELLLPPGVQRHSDKPKVD